MKKVQKDIAHIISIAVLVLGFYLVITRYANGRWSQNYEVNSPVGIPNLLLTQEAQLTNTITTAL